MQGHDMRRILFEGMKSVSSLWVHFCVLVEYLICFILVVKDPAQSQPWRREHP